MAELLRLALPNKGLMQEGAIACLTQAGFPVQRTHERQYTGRLPTLSGVELYFQRNADMYGNLASGQLDAAITGYDHFIEAHVMNDPVRVVESGLGFGACELVLAVPERWLDIVSIGDFAELATRRRAQQRPLRIATKYANTTRAWLHQRGITQCLLVAASGAMEAAPGLGYADCIVDLTASGVTLRENRLKRVHGGTLLRSEGCLIASSAPLLENEEKFATLAILLAGISATRRASDLCCLQAHVPIPQDFLQCYPNAVVGEVMWEGAQRYQVQLTIPRAEKWRVIQRLGEAGASTIQELRLEAIYDPALSARERLKEKLIAVAD
ncbi:MAG: ATP phosphoribosyltransferase [Chloroflexi bacterium]|nr:ATP phosphoribosyltransferase [Chloroflexota bacterium]